MSAASGTSATARGIDPRGPRVGAWITTGVLVLVLVTGSWWLLAAQAAVFATGAVLGVQHTPYAVVYRRLVRPRLAPPAWLEAPEPPRFAQGVGLALTGTGLLLAAAGVPAAVEAAAGAALVAAFLNAAFGLCLGCELYVTIARLRSRVN